MDEAGYGSLRLTFAYRGRVIELQNVEPVDTLAPAPPAESGLAGFALELHADDGSLLFRRMLSDPLGTSVELPAGDRDTERPFERVTVEEPSGTFIVMVPAMEGATQVALFERTGDEREQKKEKKEKRPKKPKGVEPLARFELRGRRDKGSD